MERFQRLDKWRPSVVLCWSRLFAIEKIANVEVMEFHSLADNNISNTRHRVEWKFHPIFPRKAQIWLAKQPDVSIDSQNLCGNWDVKFLCALWEEKKNYLHQAEWSSPRVNKINSRSEKKKHCIKLWKKTLFNGASSRLNGSSFSHSPNNVDCESQLLTNF